MNDKNPVRRDKNLKKIILVTIIVSFVTSSIFGFFAASLVATSPVGKWIQEKILKRGILNFGGSPPALREEEKREPSPKVLERILEQEEVTVNVVERASPAVVSIIITKDLPILEEYYVNPFEGDEFFKQFFEPGFGIPQYRQKGTEKKQVGGGTGFVVSSDGLIITNKHVVQDTSAEYTVLTNDGKKYSAKVLARDPAQDLAVIKIEKTGLPTIPLGDSNKIRMGQTVIAIGNALGEFRNTVSVGVISGLGRTISASGGGQIETLEGVIQTDAAINQGNSGGPLLNLKGEVIGINTAMVVGAQSIGFAIPINKAKKDVESIKTVGRIVTPFLGVRYILVNKDIQEKNNLSVDYGALIIKGSGGEPAVVEGSPADKAGLKEKDIILELNNTRIDQEYSLASLIQNYNVGDEITLKILRAGVEKTVKTRLEERK